MVRVKSDYQPQGKQQEILSLAMANIKSVPYQVTARWLFYRLLQGGYYHGKDDYHGRFLPLISKARKGFYDGWRPNTLADDTREIIDGGDGFDSAQEWLEAVRDQLRFRKSKWLTQDYYMEVWFEAAAMMAQFKHYVAEIPLFSFHGDCSIAAKWGTAKRIELMAERHNLPVVIVYFGDDDPKGREIPESALADIREWCGVEFDFVRGGLNPGDGMRMGLPENPDKPGTYQWEALPDKEAGELITNVIDRYYRKDALADVFREERAITDKFQAMMADLLDEWEEE